MQRVDELIRQMVAGLIEREITDPNLGFVTVTAVETTPDLRHATVWVSVFGGKPEESIALLRSSLPKIQAPLNKALQTKYVPKLEFRLDRSEEHVAQIERLLSKLDGKNNPSL